MKLVGLVVATMLVPVVPWIFLAGPLVARDWGELSIYLAAGSGLVLDLWWGTPLGLTALFLVGLSLVVRVANNWWPADQRVFWAIAVIVSLVSTEVYLALV